MRTLDLLIGLSWIAFWLYWIAAAVGALRDPSASNSSRRPRLAIFIITALVWAAAVSGHTWIGYQISQHRPWLKILGLVLFYGGLGLAIWARKYLGKNWGMPMAVKEDPQLVTGGPYAFVRHPIYAGLICAALGTFLALTLAWLLVFLLTAVYFIYSAVQEDKIMARQFPKTYPAYKRRTKMLVPYIV